jgi:succinate dehydrogenase / fumarate reductase cytochrome b subunit
MLCHGITLLTGKARLQKHQVRLRQRQLHHALKPVKGRAYYHIFRGLIMAQDGKRPISPHLGIWKPGPNMYASITHRITGDGMALVGVAGLIWGLIALSSGKEAYQTFLTAANHWAGQVVLIGLTWAFFQHMCTGLRHFVLDAGAGYELKTNRLWSILVYVIALALTVAVWGYIYFVKG